MKNKTKYLRRRKRELYNKAERSQRQRKREQELRRSAEEYRRRLKAAQDADPERQLHQRLVNILNARLWQYPGYRAMQVTRAFAQNWFPPYWW